MIFIKISGALFIVFSTTMFGVSKAARLKGNKDKLLNFILSLDTLKDKIRTGAGELKPLLENVFNNSGIVNINGEEITVLPDLDNSEKALIEDFFRGLGKSDRIGECERIEEYRKLLYKSYENRLKEYAQKSKIWQTCGLCAGLFVAIFLI